MRYEVWLYYSQRRKKRLHRLTCQLTRRECRALAQEFRNRGRYDIVPIFWPVGTTVPKFLEERIYERKPKKLKATNQSHLPAGIA